MTTWEEQVLKEIEETLATVFILGLADGPGEQSPVPKVKEEGTKLKEAIKRITEEAILQYVEPAKAMHNYNHQVINEHIKYQRKALGVDHD